jgi:O6-methylguanine-DNA--protein-cysteine methyltransferase
MARNPVPFLIPCHRVVPSSGGIGNFGLGKSRKRDLLKREGVPVELL